MAARSLAPSQGTEPPRLQLGETQNVDMHLHGNNVPGKHLSDSGGYVLPFISF